MRLMFYSYGAYLYGIDSPQAIGGAERQQWLLARCMAARGHEVVIAVPSDNSLKTRRKDEVQFVRCKPTRVLYNIQVLLRDLNPNWWYWRTNNYLLGPLFYSAHLRHIHTAYSVAFDTDCLPRQALTFRRHLWPLYAWGLQLADRILVQHSGQLDTIPTVYRQKAVLVNSIATYSTNIEETKQEPYISWVGVLRKAKRPDLLVRIARALPHIRFVVCGPLSRHRTQEGYGEKVIEELIQLKNVDYRGQVSPAEAEMIISNASLFLSTAEAEGFPNTFLQAWSARIPVVSVRVDPGSVIENNELGYVVETLDEATTLLDSLMKKTDIRWQMGENARLYVEHYHSVDYVCAQLEAALNWGV